MHYKNGREAKIGDRVIGKDHQGLPYSGVVVAATAGAETCNLTIGQIRNTITATAKECVHLDDALEVTAPEEATTV